MPRIVSRAEFARLAGVSATAVTKACRLGLARACVGKRIDLEHEAAEKYLQTHGAAKASDEAVEAVRAPSRWQQRDAEAEADGAIEEYRHWTLDQLIERFGTSTRFKDWLDATKKIEDIREKRLKNEETEGSVISRELVQTHVFGLLEAFSLRLLGDAPKTIVRRLYADAKAGRPPEDAEETARETISSHLTAVTTRAARALRERGEHAESPARSGT